MSRTLFLVLSPATLAIILTSISISLRLIFIAVTGQNNLIQVKFF